MLVCARMRKIFSRVREVGSPDCAQALAIYEKAFPPHERHPREVMQERIAAGKNQLFVGKDENVVFIALLYPLTGTTFTLLDYLATAPDARGQGWASDFLREAFADFRAREEFLMLEVEDPDFGENRGERLRRCAFYRKNGALEFSGVRYLLPPLQGHQTTEMRLMISPNYPTDTIDAALVRHIVTRLYHDLYGRPAGDPLLQSFLPEIREPVHLR